MPWFLFLLAGVAVAAHTWMRKRAGLAVRWGVAIVLIGACSLLAVIFWPGTFYAQKMMTELAMPLAVVWFSLLLIAIALAASAGRKLAASLVAGACLLLSMAGHYVVGDSLIWSLEERYFEAEPLQEEPFDAICVLGGGAWIDVKGRPVLSSSGDRIILAARLFDAGKTRQLICTGADMRSAPNFPNVAEMSETIFAQLGVPEGAVVFAGGDTTKTELAALTRLVSEHQWKRVGLVTSAWHMPRVERLARGAGVVFVPLPADFRSAAEAELPLWDKVRRFSVIPTAGALQQTHIAVKEYLAVLAGR